MCVAGERDQVERVARMQAVERQTHGFLRLLNGEPHHGTGGIEHENQFLGRDLFGLYAVGRLHEEGEVSGVGEHGIFESAAANARRARVARRAKRASIGRPPRAKCGVGGIPFTDSRAGVFSSVSNIGQTAKARYDMMKSGKDTIRPGGLSDRAERYSWDAAVSGLGSGAFCPTDMGVFPA